MKTSTRLLLPILLLAACSKAPQYTPNRSGGGSGNQDGTGTDGGKGSNGSKEDPADKIPGLSLNFQRLEGLSFKALMDKLAHVAGLKPDEAGKHEAFAKILEKRYVLGDYNYSIRNSGSTVWETTNMISWMEASLPYCQSKIVKDKYETSPEAFTEALLARPFGEKDKTILDEIGKLSKNTEEIFEMNCLTHINSLEFRNQWPSAKPDLSQYVQFISGTLLHLPDAPRKDEVTLKNLEAVIEDLTSSDRLLLSARLYLDHLMQTSGKADGVDYDLPSNILSAIIREKKPYGSILYLDSCYDAAGAKIACDSGAPQPAGILSSRAFLKTRYGAYNIFRASALVDRFMCSSYPLNARLEPPVEAEELIEKFATTDGEGFGNGSNCYACHSQFAKHTQIFVKFDPEGIYKANADGVEDKMYSSAGGYTSIGTMASHYKDSSVSGSEKSNMLGKPVESLREAGKVLAESDIFLDCSIRHLLQHYLRLSTEESSSLSDHLLKDIRDSILKESKQPSMQLILKKALSHPKVVQSFTSP